MQIFRLPRHALSDQVARIRTINHRYATPRIAVSPVVRWSLLALRIYLLMLVALLGYKFVSIVVH
jgi:hypothetical protein